MYIAEISSAKLRGVFSLFMQVLLCVGLIVVYLMGSFASFKYYHSALVLAALVAVSIVMVVFVCESPRWLLKHGRRSQAIVKLKLLRGIQYNIIHEVSGIMEEIRKSQIQRKKWTEVLKLFTTRAVLYPFFIGVSVHCFQQVGGITAATAYSASIFRDAGVENYRLTSTYAVGAVQFISTLFAIYFVDLFGRKFLLTVSGIGLFVACVLLGVEFYITRPSFCLNSTAEILSSTDITVSCNSQYAPMAIVAIILYFSSFTIGWGSLPGLIQGEVLPLSVRGVA